MEIPDLDPVLTFLCPGGMIASCLWADCVTALRLTATLTSGPTGGPRHEFRDGWEIRPDGIGLSWWSLYDGLAY